MQNGPSWVIGSAAECDVRVQSPTVSARHCRLSKRGTKYLLEDLGSSNGTYLEGKRLTSPTLIDKGDSVTLGLHVPMPWPTEAKAISIGRLADNDVVVDRDTVSGRHARLEFDGEHYLLVDLMSTNGVAINDPRNRVAGSAPLKPGETVFLGTHAVSASELIQKLSVLPDHATILESSMPPQMLPGVTAMPESASGSAQGRAARERRQRTSSAATLLAIALGGVTAIGLYFTPPFQAVMKTLRTSLYGEQESRVSNVIADKNATPISEPTGLDQIVDAIEPSVMQLLVTRDRGAQSLGSAFVIEREGYCITNYHVIRGAQSIECTHRDRRRAEVLGFVTAVPDKDVVILKTDSQASPLKLSRTRPRKGERVLAIGTPRGYEFTVSDGIVSGLRQGISLRGRDPRIVWVQHTAPVSPGASGGPLVNRNGQVIAMNTWVDASGTNLSFAIAAEVLLQLLIDIERQPIQPLSSLPDVDYGFNARTDR